MENHVASFDRLIFVHPEIEFNTSNANVSDLIGDFDFDAKRDQIGLGHLLKKAQNMTVEMQTEFVDLLRSELKPLGRAVQMGVDQTLETLIDVIVYMSENTSAVDASVDERTPDQERKLRRFEKHAEFLLDQFRVNQDLHASVQNARAAIGYDTVRAAKIQAWLKLNSLDALDLKNGDAREAFRHLVQTLLEKAQVRGNDAEETAVRFLIADEFIRCNVFPNPSV
nr:hypothetical protein [Rhodopirellula baltica]